MIYRACRDRYKWTPQEFDMIDIRRINRIYKELKEDAEKSPNGHIDEDDLS